MKKTKTIQDITCMFPSVFIKESTLSGRTRYYIPMKLTINSKANKHLMGKKIVKTIFVKNKIINYITE